MAMMSKLQSAYLAGLIDGEGYVGILCVRRGQKSKWHSQRDCYFTPVLKVAMTDRKMIEWLYRSFGGTFEVRPARENAKESYCWALRKAHVEKFLRCLYPFLKTKKRDAEIVFAFHRTNKGPGHRISDEVHAERLRLYGEIRALHSRAAPVETK